MRYLKLFTTDDAETWAKLSDISAIVDNTRSDSWYVILSNGAKLELMDGFYVTLIKQAIMEEYGTDALS